MSCNHRIQFYSLSLQFFLKSQLRFYFYFLDWQWFKEINRNASINIFYSILAVLFLIKEFKIFLSKLGFQKLNKIFNSQVRFFGYIIIFRSTKMLPQISDLRLCALMRLCPYVLVPLCPFALISLRPYVCALISGFVRIIRGALFSNKPLKILKT